MRKFHTIISDCASLNEITLANPHTDLDALLECTSLGATVELRRGECQYTYYLWNAVHMKYAKVAMVMQGGENKA